MMRMKPLLRHSPNQTMSISRLSQELGAPPKWREELWPLMEESALELIQEACLLLKSYPERDTHWRERHYSLALFFNLIRLCESRDLPFVPMDERSQLSEEDFKAGSDPKKAPQIDLALYWHNLDRAVFFGVEAKVVVMTAVNKYTHSATIRGYVDDGMKRYVDGRYAANLKTGAMVSYVLSGKPSELVPKINDRINILPLPCTQLLIPCPIPAAPKDRYESKHPRERMPEIRLCHIFVVFN